MQYRPEPLKDGIVGFGRVLCEEEADFAHEAHGDFDRVVSGAFEAEEEDLEGDEFVRDVLVDKVGDEGGCGVTDGLGVSYCPSKSDRCRLPCHYACRRVGID